MTWTVQLEAGTPGIRRASAHMPSIIRTNQQNFIGAGEDVPIYFR